MQKRLKRIFALICAFALLVTTVLGNSAIGMVQAADSTEPTPVTLDGFTNVTLKDFVDSSGTQMVAGTYAGKSASTRDSYYMKDLTSFDKVLLSMTVKFATTGGGGRIEFGGISDGKGYAVYPNGAGNLLFVDVNSMTGTYNCGYVPTGTEGVETFKDTEFLLQMSIEYGDFDDDASDTAKNDVKLGIYINGKAYSGSPFIITNWNTSKIGNYMSVYRDNASASITVGNVEIASNDSTETTGPTPVTLEGFTNVSIEDFVDSNGSQMPEGTYTGKSGGVRDSYYMKDLTSFDKVLLSMTVKFATTGGGGRIEFGGISDGKGYAVYPNGAGNLLFVDVNSMTGTYNCGYVPTGTEGVETFKDTEFLLQLSFEYGDFDDDASDTANNDVKMGVYINGKAYSGSPFIITNWNTAKIGNYISVYRNTASDSVTIGNVGSGSDDSGDSDDSTETTGPTPVTLEGFTNISIEDFVDSNDSQMAEGTYTGKSGGVRDSFYMKDLTSFDKVLLSMTVKYATSGGGGRIEFGGISDGKGYAVYPNGAGNLLFVDVNSMTGTYNCGYVPTGTEGVETFKDTEFLLQLSFEYGDYDNGGTSNDVKIGVYINGAAYSGSPFTIYNWNTAKIGNYMSVYRNTASDSVTIGNVGSSSDDSGDSDDSTETTGPTPVILEGFTKVSIQNFVDSDGNQMQEGTYEGGNAVRDKYYVPSLTNFDKVLLSMNVKFATTGGGSRIEIGGVSDGKGYAIYPNGSGNLLFVDLNSLTDTYNCGYVATGTEGVETFKDTEFLLQLSFEYGDYDNGGTSNDVKIGVYINGAEYSDSPFIIYNWDMTKMGSYLSVYRNTASDSVTIGNVEGAADDLEEPAIEYDIVTMEDFKDANGNALEAKAYKYIAQNIERFYAEGYENFDEVAVSLTVRLKYGGSETRFDIGGINEWSGIQVYSNTAGDYLFVVADSNYGVIDTWTGTKISAETAGVDSFLDTEFKLQLNFNFGDVDSSTNKADLQVGVYINDKLCETVSFTGCNMAKFGNYIGLYRAHKDSVIILGEGTPDDSGSTGEPEEPEVLDASYEKVTFSHFGIKDATYPYNGDIVVQSSLKGKDTLNKIAVCGNVLLEGSGSFHLIFGGDSAWNGLRLITSKVGNLNVEWHQGKESQYITTLFPEDAGVNFIGEEYKLMVSMELIDDDGDGKVNDIKVGVWFNEVLYDNQYLIIKDCGDQLGNMFAAYCDGTDATVTLNSIPELIGEVEAPKQPNASFEKITFEYFGVADGTYKYDGTKYATVEGKASQSLDGKVLCGDIYLSGTGENHIMYGGNGNVWYGFRFITRQNGTIVLYWIDDEGLQLIDIFDATSAGTKLIDNWFNIMISTEIVDADGDGEKDDIELGVWFDGVLYKEQYYTVLNKASGFGKQFGIDCAGEDNYVSIRSIAEYVKGFDYSIYGLTADWQKTLLTDYSSETAVGGSRDAEPFTGDLLALGKVCLLASATVIALGAGMYIMLRRKREY